MENNKNRSKIIIQENLKHTCCNGQVYYDGRCGDGPIYIHQEGCPVGKREKLEADYWNMDTR